MLKLTLCYQHPRVHDNHPSSNPLTINIVNSSSLPSTHEPSHITMSDNGTGAPVANVDDAAGFMAAARAFRQQKEAEAAAAAAAAPCDDFGGQIDVVDGQDAAFGGQADAFDGQNGAFNGQSAFDPSVDDFCPEAKQTNGFGTSAPWEIDPEILTSLTSSPADVEPQKDDLLGSAEEPIHTPPEAPAAPSTAPSAGQDEDREHKTTFKSWGAREARDKPGKLAHLYSLAHPDPATAARVRRVILKGLPSSWRVPAKVLSLVHGGAVENIHISAAGNAIVHFCEPEACKTFYDRYPNGIYLDREKGLSVFVEIGNEVDVISSQLLQYLSVGASRVVRAVGVSENISMGQLHKISTLSNRKVERILDDLVVGEVSTPPSQILSVGSMARLMVAGSQRAHRSLPLLQYRRRSPLPWNDPP